MSLYINISHTCMGRYVYPQIIPLAAPVPSARHWSESCPNFPLPLRQGRNPRENETSEFRRPTKSSFNGPCYFAARRCAVRQVLLVFVARFGSCVLPRYRKVAGFIIWHCAWCVSQKEHDFLDLISRDNSEDSVR